MPRFGFISDVHGNLEAFEAVLRDIACRDIDALISLGDVIGYGPNPGECLDVAAQQCDALIRGNHDEAVLTPAMQPAFNPRAWRSIEQALGVLEPGHLMLIESMRDRGEFAGIGISHATFGPRRFEYLYDERSAQASFAAMKTRIGVVGHTHIPCAIMRDESGSASNVWLVEGDEVSLESVPQAILNPGSVGQPRDRNPRASWGVLDTDRWTFRVHRVEYDVDEVQRKMSRLGLPDYHALRLKAGV